MIEEMKIKYCENDYEDKRHDNCCKNNKCSCIELVIAILAVLFVGIIGVIIGAVLSAEILAALPAIIVLAIVLFILLILGIIILICCKKRNKTNCFR